MTYPYDLVVLGAGPGGYVAAARASALGLKVAVVEKDSTLGGTCLNRGCIPTKALLHAADLYSEIKEASQIGITVEGAKVDWEKIQKYKSRVISTNAGGVSHLMKSRKVEVITGFGTVKSPHEVAVGDKVLSTKNILLAVGSTPRSLPFAPAGGRILNSDTALDLPEIPGSLVVIGGGVIGIEFASLFVRMGTKVNVIEALPRILAPADPDCSKELVTQLEAQGVVFHTGASVTGITSKGKSTKTAFKTQTGEELEISSDYVLAVHR